MGEADEVAERPNLPVMRVACKHKAYAFLGSDVYVPRRMRDKHRCDSRRAASKGLRYEVAGFAVAAPSGKVINACQNQTWFYLGPAVVKHVESSVLEHASTAF